MESLHLSFAVYGEGFQDICISSFKLIHASACAKKTHTLLFGSAWLRFWMILPSCYVAREEFSKTFISSFPAAPS